MAVGSILVVDDDAALADLLGLTLQDAGYETSAVVDGPSALSAVHASPPDLVLLDIGLPGLDGFEVCRRLRTARLSMPIIMLTSRAEDLDKVLGLELGADDYVTKPFSSRELVARIRAVLRRSGVGAELVPEPDPASIAEVGRLRVDRAQWRAHFDGIELTLTSTEFELLWALVGEPGNVLSRDALILAVYGPDVVVSDRSIDTFVKRIRRKLADIDPDVDALQTVRGVGYRMVL